MQFRNNLNQNEYKMIIISIKANLYIFSSKIHHEHLALQRKFLVSFLITYKSMFGEVIPKQRVKAFLAYT